MATVDKVIEAWVLLLYEIKDTELMNLRFFKIRDCLRSIIRRINKHPSKVEPHAIDSLSILINHLENEAHRRQLDTLLRALDSNSEFELVLIPT